MKNCKIVGMIDDRYTIALKDRKKGKEEERKRAFVREKEGGEFR